MKHKLLCIPLALFTVMVVLFGWQLMKNAEGDDPTSLESVLVGKPIPEIYLEILENTKKHVDQSIFFDGKPWLINFWGTWCPTCRVEHQYLNVLAKRGVRIVGINYKDDRMKAMAWLKALGSPYIVNLYDPKGLAGLDFGVYGAPETFLIDGDGIVRFRYSGNVTPDIWRKNIAPLWLKYQNERDE